MAAKTKQQIMTELGVVKRKNTLLEKEKIETEAKIAEAEAEMKALEEENRQLLEKQAMEQIPGKVKKRFFLARWLDGRDGQQGNLKSQYFYPALIVVAAATVYICHYLWA